MTLEEAIKGLQNIIEQWTYRPAEVETAKLAIKALEKQIQKKPLPYRGWEGKCPTCGVVFLDRATNYCGNCGQALDWGETE